MKVLILGDGNFSFAHAFCKQIQQQTNNPSRFLCNATSSLNPTSVTATSFDSAQALATKYPESTPLLATLANLKNTTLLHDINAWELDTHFDEKFDCVIWNHPHLGTEDFRLHRFLMAHFFDSVKKILTPYTSERDEAMPVPTICISFVAGQSTRWQITEQAKRSGFMLHSSEPLEEGQWEGWHVKRNKNGKSFKNNRTLTHVEADMTSSLFRFRYTGDCTLDTQPVSEDVDPEDHTDVVIDKPKKVKTGAFQCEKCPRSFTTLQGVKTHDHTCHILNLYGKDWQGHDRISTKPIIAHTEHPTNALHTKTNHVDYIAGDTKTFKCDTCDKHFCNAYARYQHQINVHTEIHEGEVDLTSTLANINLNLDTNTTLLATKDYDYTPCEICGQAILNKRHGMLLHLETLKPLIGLQMKCPKCSCFFIEQRALFQHYKFCRVEKDERVVGESKGKEI